MSTTTNVTSISNEISDAPTGRDRILSVAAELFVAKGYDGTSLRTIGDAVGMQPASIYHHFESKDHLLEAILDIGIEAIGSAFDEVSEMLTDDTPGSFRLEAHIAAHLQALFANEAFTAAHVTVFYLSPDSVREVAVPARDAYEARWTRLLEQVVPKLSKKARTYIRLSLLGAMNSTLNWFDPENGTIEDLASAMANNLWNGWSSYE